MEKRLKRDRWVKEVNGRRSGFREESEGGKERGRDVERKEWERV